MNGNTAKTNEPIWDSRNSDEPQIRKINMNTALINLVVMGIQFLLKEAPGAIAGIRTLVNKPNPTDADFEAAKEQIRNDTYKKLVPNSQL